MTIDTDPEERAFRDACGKLAADLAAHWALGRGPADVAPPLPAPADWAKLADAGWLGLCLREENGGAEAGTFYASLLVTEVARAALPAPVLGTLLAARQLEAYGADPELLASIAAGETRVAPLLRPDLTGFANSADSTGVAGSAGRTDSTGAVGSPVNTDAVGRAASTDGADSPGNTGNSGFTRDVTTIGAALAWDAAGADFAVSVPDGAAHQLAAAPGGADLTRAVRAALPEAPPARPPLRLNHPSQSERARVDAFALALLTADLLGVMEAAHAAAVAHAKTRTQYGAPIGSFEAIADLAAEGKVLLEATRTAAWYAAWSVDAEPPQKALHAARVAKAFASRAAVEVCEAVVQIFGGIGFTWEFPAHVWLRRAHASRLAFGSEHHHEAILAAEAFTTPPTPPAPAQSPPTPGATNLPVGSDIRS
jgi:alkylation response protein AidB-like acyl-CoA dehydrogenase